MYFVLTCILGFVSGVTWGTEEVSLVSIITLFLALIFLILDIRKDYLKCLKQ